MCQNRTHLSENNIAGCIVLFDELCAYVYIGNGSFAETVAIGRIEMDVLNEDVREDTLMRLWNSLSELEAGHELSDFVVGHGFQSRHVEFFWEDESLLLSIYLPYGQVLALEETRKLSEMDLSVALRLALLLLNLSGEGSNKLRVIWNEFGLSYIFTNSEGELIEWGDDASRLVHMLHLEVGQQKIDDGITVVWP